MEVFNNEYQKVNYDADNSTLEQIWLPKTADMSTEDFKNNQKKMLSIFTKENPSKLFVSLKDLNYVVEPKIQKWTNENIMQPLAKNGLQKAAFLVSSDMFTQASAEQTMDEDVGKAFPVKFFKNEEEAKNWLA